LFLLLYVQSMFELVDLTVLRWIFGPIVFILIIVALDFRSNRSNQNFKILWFSGFTRLIAAIITFLGITFITRDLVWSSLDKGDIVYILFMEGVNQLFIALIILSIITALFTKLNRKTH